MNRIITLIVLTICVATILAGCSQEVAQKSEQQTEQQTGQQAEQKDYAPYGYEVLTGCWVREYRYNDYKWCEGIQFFSDGKCILRNTNEYSEGIFDKFLYEYYTEEGGILRIEDKLFHYSLTEDTLTLSNAEETREYKLWDKDINYIKELCPYHEYPYNY